MHGWLVSMSGKNGWDMQSLTLLEPGIEHLRESVLIESKQIKICSLLNSFQT